jgi:signal recognition particle receptor subunit beta
MTSSNFEVKIAFVGYKLDGKSTTLLAATLKDFYSDISTPTAGINSFRIIGRSTNLDGSGGGSGKAESSSICNEIAQDNNNDDPIISRLQEKVFDIVMDVDDPICEMREDTSLVFVDIPGISLVEDCRFRKFLDDNWDTFDCVVLVLDCLGNNAAQRENQTLLLRNVRKRRYETKQVPVIVVCNQFEDTDDGEQARQVAQMEALIKEVFGERDRDKKYDQVGFSSKRKTGK